MCVCVCVCDIRFIYRFLCCQVMERSNVYELNKLPKDPSSVSALEHLCLKYFCSLDR